MDVTFIEWIALGSGILAWLILLLLGGLVSVAVGTWALEPYITKRREEREEREDAQHREGQRESREAWERSIGITEEVKLQEEQEWTEALRLDREQHPARLQAEEE